MTSTRTLLAMNPGNNFTDLSCGRVFCPTIQRHNQTEAFISVQSCITIVDGSNFDDKIGGGKRKVSSQLDFPV